jgi:hypothetical protein
MAGHCPRLLAALQYAYHNIIDFMARYNSDQNIHGTYPTFPVTEMTRNHNEVTIVIEV